MLITTALGLLVTIYLQILKPWLVRPKLSWAFIENNNFLREIAFETFPKKYDFDHQIIGINRPGFNARIKILNNGKTTAKRVQGRVECLRLFNRKTEKYSIIEYHPTVVKWSGEETWNPVDIAPKSHFFLDLFWVKNERIEEILNFNFNRYRGEINKENLEVMIKENSPADEVYWNVWIDNNWNRGVPTKIRHEGDISADFIINGDNCDPIRLNCSIVWFQESWNKPKISIRQIRYKEG